MIESIEQGRKEDGSRSIADKIKRRLHELDKTVESNYGRWVWELLQNAKDSISDDEENTVSIQIEVNNDSVVFMHNGSYFKELDIRGLINQISSKEVEEGVQTKNTGRFGTGFLTTHLLSRKVEISGIVKTDTQELHSFKFLLDREGTTTAELAPKVEASWKNFQESTCKVCCENNKTFNTSFRYILNTPNQQDILKKGINEFYKLIPFVLAFIPKINEVQIKINFSNKSVVFKNARKTIDNIIKKIEKIEDGIESEILIAQVKNDEVSIAAEVEATKNGYALKNMQNIPKLFCDFPLIGTENFHFPIIVNSFYFSPQTERDGIWLKGESDYEVVQNQELLKKSVELYKTLINQLSKESYFDFYNIATTKIPAADERYFDKDWYVNEIQKPLRKFLEESEIVETSNGKIKIKDVSFPDKNFIQEDREKIWKFSLDLKVNKLPIKKDIQKWADVIWGDCKVVDVNDLVTDLKAMQNILTLRKTLEVDESEMFDWLKECLSFIEKHNPSMASTNNIIPDQEGNFKISRELHLDEIDDETLKEISKQAGYNYYSQLVHQNLFLENYPSKKSIEDIAAKITSLINDDKEFEGRNLAITMLIEWFEDNKEKGKKYFSSLYNKKEKLLVDTIKDKDSLFAILNSNVTMTEIADIVLEIKKNPDQVKDNTRKANEFDNLLEEYGAKNVSELKKLIIAEHQSNSISNIDSKLSIDTVEIDKEVLSSLGVSTPEEFAKLLENKNIPQKFIHTSTPTKEMFEFAQEKIKRAKNNIINYLQDQDDYDCGDLEELSSTVLGGIKKHGLDIYIVVRPSDNRQVIIYYPSEKDSLDYEFAELWIDNGKSNPTQLTLGKILKNTGITRIPV